MAFNRHGYYGLIHKGVKALLMARMGFFDDNEYRNYLASKTRQMSCKLMTDAQLRALVEELKREGFLEDYRARRPGGRGPQRPTDLQWAKLTALAKARGWSGLEAPELDTFVERTVKLPATRFLTRSLISQVILGLERWNEGDGHGDHH